MDNIRDIIYSDLSKYNQDNPAPKSLDIQDGENWRHYELDECIGLMTMCERYIYNGTENSHTITYKLSEDDGHYYLNDKNTSFDSHWLLSYSSLYKRMYNWLLENCERGYLYGHDGDIDMICGFKDKKY